MSDKKYNVVFSGKFLKGKDISEIKRNLCNGPLKNNKSKVNAFLSGKKFIIKRNVDLETASKYADIFNASGLLCTIDSSESEAASTQGNPPGGYKRKSRNTQGAETSAPCPKCGYGNNDETALECIKCGVIFSKFTQVKPPTSPPRAGSGTNNSEIKPGAHKKLKKFRMKWLLKERHNRRRQAEYNQNQKPGLYRWHFL